MRLRFPALGTLAACAALAGPPLYDVTDLGTLGGRESRAYGVNAAGAACGEAATAEGTMHAFAWTAAGGIRDLGTLGGPTSRGYGINDAGWVVGEADATNALRQPFCWTPADGLRALPLPPGAVGGAALAVAGSGQMVGAVDLPDGPCAALWMSPTNVPALLTAKGRAGLALAISPAGGVVGQSEVGEGDDLVTRAFFRPADGVVAALSPLGDGLSSAARAINAAGQIAGSFEAGTGVTHAFVFDANGLRDIDTRNNTFSEAHGINASGDVVGVCFVGPDDGDAAFLATAEGQYLLDDLVEARESWHVVEARAIADDRRIAGCALRDERERAVLLIPRAGAAPDLPTVRIIAPAAGLRLAPGAGVDLEAEATAREGVKRVTFLANDVVIGTATAAPFRLSWKDVPPGEVDLVARAVGRTGRANESSRVRIRSELPPNALPVVTWLAPTGEVIRLAGGGYEFRAEARDPDGRVVGMELWQDGTVIASAEGASLQEVWSGGPAEVYEFRVVAEDERGGRGTSTVLRVELGAAAAPEPATNAAPATGGAGVPAPAGGGADLKLE